VHGTGGAMSTSNARLQQHHGAAVVRVVLAVPVATIVVLAVPSGDALAHGTRGDGAVTTFGDPSHRLRHPRDIAAGPDGNLWFTADRELIGRITEHGDITFFTDPAGRIHGPNAIVAGPDGAMWFTNLNGVIGRAAMEAGSRASRPATVWMPEPSPSRRARTATCRLQPATRSGASRPRATHRVRCHPGRCHDA
jgi:streptogramin lyase